MKNYNVNIDIEAESPEQVQEKLQGFQDLMDIQDLDHEDLMQAIEVIVENPNIITFIKRVVPQGDDELSVGDYLRIAKEAYVEFG